MEFGDARVGAEKEKYGILGKTVKIIKTPLARHNHSGRHPKPTIKNEGHIEKLKFVVPKNGNS